MTDNSWTWVCNGKTFSNKWHAIKEHNHSGDGIRLDSPGSYDDYPMHLETQDSWADVLAERALEIRESSTRVNIMFSGGIDSTQVLDTFVANNIFIDEITCIKHGIPESDDEVDHVALPYLAKLQLDPRTKINVVTRTIADYEQYYKDPYWIERETRGLMLQFRLTNLSENLCYDDSDSGTTWVLGKEKPTLVHKNNKWYCYFLDCDVEPHQTNKQNTVYFYSGSAKVHAKQSHMLKNYMVGTLAPEQYNTPSAINRMSENHLNTGCGRIPHAGSFFIPKSRDIMELRDHKGNTFNVVSKKEYRSMASVLQDQHMTHLVDNFRQGVLDFTKDIGTQFFNYGDPLLGTIGVFSKFYCLDAPEVLTVDELYPDGWTASL
jgi:hypothetical protein